MTERTERKLAAILAADVAGYSRLISRNEEATIGALKGHRRELIDPTIRAHRGRIANTAGDSLLVEFASAVDAVRCAVDIQFGMAQRNTNVPEEQRIVFRMGINVGDVVVQGQDLLGDGVNVAARLEQIAEPGGINLSRTVRDQIQDKLSFTFDALGDQIVKNIPRPVEVSRVRWEGYTPASLSHSAVQPKSASRLTKRRVVLAVSVAAALALIVAGGLEWMMWHARSATQIDERPGIAVLPFTNLSDDKGQEYFSDGLTEDFITELSHFSQLKVIARNSTFRYRGQAVDIERVGKELGVRYVLEGSVRRVADQVRITGQLIEASTGGHIWAQHYDRSQKEVFAVQDEMTRTIVSLIVSNVQEVDFQKAVSKPTGSQTAYDLFLLGRSQMRAANPADYQRAVNSYERAIAVDPVFADAHAGLGNAYRIGSLQGWGTVPKAQLFSKADMELSQAVALNPRLAEAHGWLGIGRIFSREFGDGFAEVQKAYSLNPNSITVLETVAYGNLFMGRHQEAAKLYEEVLKLDPFPEATTLVNIGRVNLHLRKYDQALVMAEKAIAMAPKFSVSYLVQAASYVNQGRLPEARSAIAAHQALRPNFTMVTAYENNPFYNESDTDFYLSALRKAGIPEK